MALSFFSGSGGASHAKYFDIRLEDQYVIFRGGEHEASSAHLRGTLVLCLSEPLTIKYLRLHLLGMSRICWYLPPTPTGGSKKQWKERAFFEKTWGFRDAGKGKTEVLPAGNYEFPFDVILEGSLPESVEGLKDTWVTYRFKAEMGRKYAKNIIVRKPLRIVRTLDPSALEISHAMSVENIWPNKIEYSISTPNKAVIFGTSVRIDFRLIPLLKGLRIGEIVSQLVECHDLTLNPEDPGDVRNIYKTSRTIITDDYGLDEENQLEIIDEAAEGYQFSRDLKLPKTLTYCLQDVDTKGIKVKHKLRFRVQLHNPDGHVSELRATLPVLVYISPNLLIDENNTLIDSTPQAAQRAIEDSAFQAPPLYGEHQFDQLYSEVDVSGYRTPGNSNGSGSGTPFSTLSRNLSAENLASMNAITNSDISASALHSRLTSLHASHTPSSDVVDHHLDADAGNRRSANLSVRARNSRSPESTSTGASRRHSEEVERDHVPSGAVTPYSHLDEIEALSRVPSYSTAVRTAVKTPCHTDLPDYQSATAGDLVPLPPRSPEPEIHHDRECGRFGLPHTFAEQFHRHSFFLSRSSGHAFADDGERRLRLAQARAR